MKLFKELETELMKLTSSSDSKYNSGVFSIYYHSTDPIVVNNSQL